jgi:acetoin utilization deacetylase AcuC-like enzyme
VLFVSSHQYPYYPGTGAADETGVGSGAGFTVNLPLEAGATDADYQLVYESVVLPVLEQFRPELILVSAGFDAYADDPLGGMRVSASQFGRMLGDVAAAADRLCEGRLVAVTEGGYDLAGLRTCLNTMIEAFGDEPARRGAADPGSGDSTRRAEACLRAVRPHLLPYWTL